ncbi:MAG: IPT/TIG domain-containing protein [Candidatus Bipolaricaulia bacterium]
MNRRFLIGVLLVPALGLTACDLLRSPGDGGIITLQLSPTRGTVRSEVIIVGEGFGALQGTGAVTFDNAAASILSWSDSILTVEVPVIATPGGASVPTEVIVKAEGGTNGQGEFTVVRGILFESERNGSRDIWMIDPEGADPIQLTDDVDFDVWPCWSHDGTKILFNRDTETWVMNADGSGQMMLAGGVTPVGAQVWSPDDAKIAFQSGEISEIRVMNADGSGHYSVTPVTGIHAWPTWSSDGRRIAFHADRDIVVGDVPSLMDNPDIFVVDVDGAAEIQLTTHPGRDWLPVWSPDGSKILFLSDRNGPGEIFSMNPNGTQQTNLTTDPGADGWPAWSPDGSKIAFQSYRDGSAEVYVMNADGSVVIRLTSNTAFDGGPSWSRDGTRISFESDRDGNLEIYVMNADGSDQTRLTHHAAFDGYPVWTESHWIPIRP